jgi:hypothetical protein
MGGMSDLLNGGKVPSLTPQDRITIGNTGIEAFDLNSVWSAIIASSPSSRTRSPSNSTLSVYGDCWTRRPMRMLRPPRNLCPTLQTRQ